MTSKFATSLYTLCACKSNEQSYTHTHTHIHSVGTDVEKITNTLVTHIHMHTHTTTIITAASPGMIAHAYVEKVQENGILLAFYGRLK